MFFDTHAHLDDEALLPNLSGILEEMDQVGVRHVLVPAVSRRGWDSLLQLISYPSIRVALGIHPSEAEELGQEQDLHHYLPKKGVVALGEIGLDYYWVKDNKEKQQELFYHQLIIAKGYRLPVLIHDREAHEDVRRLLEEAGSYETGVIFHAYSGSAEMARQDVKRGAMISLAGTVTFKNARVPKEVANIVPLEQLLVETDSPYLTPHPFRGRLNTPAKLPLIVEEIAGIKGVSVETVAKASFNNACRVFSL